MFRNTVLAIGALVWLSAASAPAQEAVLGQVYGSGVHRYFSGDYRGAYDDLSAAINGGSKDPRAYYFRGLAFLKLGRPEQATMDFQTGADLEITNAGRPVDVARALERIQGSQRATLERYRVMARMAAAERVIKTERQAPAEIPEPGSQAKEVKPEAIPPGKVTPKISEQDIDPLQKKPILPKGVTEPEPKEEPVAEPKEEPAAEPKGEPAAEPKEEPGAEPMAEKPAKPPMEPGAEPATEPAGKADQADPFNGTKPGAGPGAGGKPGSFVGKITRALGKAAAGDAGGAGPGPGVPPPTPEPPGEPAPEPPVKPEVPVKPEPAPVPEEPAAEPETKPATKPEAKPPAKEEEDPFK